LKYFIAFNISFEVVFYHFFNFSWEHDAINFIEPVLIASEVLRTISNYHLGSFSQVDASNFKFHAELSFSNAKPSMIQV
jgi:hypothetical protein